MSLCNTACNSSLVAISPARISRTFTKSCKRLPSGRELLSPKRRSCISSTGSHTAAAVTKHFAVPFGIRQPSAPFFLVGRNMQEHITTTLRARQKRRG